jgi:hypothetical protein
MKADAALGPMEVTFREIIRDMGDRDRTTTPSKMCLAEAEVQSFSSLNFKSDEFDDFRLGFYFFDALDLRKEFHIKNKKMFCLLFCLKDSYENIAYFNWKHAKRCAHFLCNALHQIGLEKFTAEERLALLLAVLAHDLRHCGFTTEYRQNVEPLLTYLFGTSSSMKCQQCSVFINLVSREECDIFKDIHSVSREAVLKLVIDLIAVTDMKKWAEALGLRGDPMYKLKLLVIFCHLGDLSRADAIAKEAREYLADEVFETGDLTRVKGIRWEEEGVPNREESLFAVVWSVFLPVYKAAVIAFPELEMCLKSLQENMMTWKMPTE